MGELPKVGLAPMSLAEPVGNEEESHEVAEPANSIQRRSAKECLGKRMSGQDRLQHNKKKYLTSENPRKGRFLIFCAFEWDWSHVPI